MKIEPREIKYDIILWDGENPKTIEHYNLEEAVREDLVKLHPLKPRDESVIIREYTTKEDINAKKIYEGDILKDAGIVAWNDVELKWSCIDIEWNDQREWHDMLYLTTPLEIIGNIYANPIKENKLTN